VRDLEQELNTEIYPGTEIMTDVGSHHFVKAGTGTHSVLVPQPSDDEHDPLVSAWIYIRGVIADSRRIGHPCGRDL
jgi:hypothetical protein